MCNFSLGKQVAQYVLFFVMNLCLLQSWSWLVSFEKWHCWIFLDWCRLVLLCCSRDAMIKMIMQSWSLLIFLQEWKSSFWFINYCRVTIKENKDHGEVDYEYNSLCKWDVSAEDENRGQILEFIIGGKKPKQDVSKEWNCSRIQNTNAVLDEVCLCDLHALCRRITLILAMLQDWEEFTVISQEMRKWDLLLRSLGSPCRSPRRKLRAITNCWNSNVMFYHPIYSVLLKSH